MLKGLIVRSGRVTVKQHDYWPDVFDRSLVCRTLTLIDRVSIEEKPVNRRSRLSRSKIIHLNFDLVNQNPFDRPSVDSNDRIFIDSDSINQNSIDCNFISQTFINENYVMSIESQVVPKFDRGSVCQRSIDVHLIEASLIALEKKLSHSISSRVHPSWHPRKTSSIQVKTHHLKILQTSNIQNRYCPLKTS